MVEQELDVFVIEKEIRHGDSLSVMAACLNGNIADCSRGSHDLRTISNPLSLILLLLSLIALIIIGMTSCSRRRCRNGRRRRWGRRGRC